MTRLVRQGETTEENVTQNKPVLYIVACGAGPAGESIRLVEHAKAVGFTTCVVTTPMARRFIDDFEQLREATGYPVRSDYKQPDEPDALPLANAFLIAPLTFNTLNAWAAGFSPTLALGLLNESLGMSAPITAVPWINAQLAAHPAATPSLERLRGAGVHFTSGFAHRSTRIPGPDGQVGAPVYPWDEIEQAIGSMYARCS
jgi:Flavoprotein